MTRPPAVYRGNPFQVEVGLAYGGELPADELIELYRLANRVPLQYQASACAITKSVLTVDWRAYGLQMSKGALPARPDGAHGPHRLGLGALHLGVEGGDRLTTPRSSRSSAWR